MSKAISELQETATNGDRQPQPEEIRQQLARILASSVFSGSHRCQQFLEHVCEKSLAGESGALKERSIAVEVFGRPPNTDLGENTIVRVGAREVRKRLAQYYVTPDGAAAAVRIDLPSGSYAPEFHYTVASKKEPAVPVVTEESHPRFSRKQLLLITVGLLGAAGVAAAVKFNSVSPNLKAFQDFWEPVLQTQESLLIAMAHPIVYHPSGRAIRLSEQNLPPQEIPFQRPIAVSPQELNGTDMVPVTNQYVGFGDMVAATQISGMLAHQSHDVRVRMASGIEFGDLRMTKLLLIGAVTNRWTMELQQAWRFRFNWTPGTRTVIVDTQANPPTADGKWSVMTKDDGSTPNDYMLVCRIHSAYTGGLIMMAAGLKQFGTEAAGRLLADPEQLGTILRKLPPGWKDKNLQVVLHARVIGNAPTLPDVVASYVW